ncbi:MAG: sodium:solute symporter [Myxococcota bacterium]
MAHRSSSGAHRLVILGFIGLYVLVQLALGAWVARQVHSDEDYLVAGRRLGPALATASMFATWFGAETCVGAAGEAYAEGLGGVAADPFGYGLTLVFFGLFVAQPLWRMRCTTIADLYGQRYSAGVERTVALLMVPGSLFWAAAQLRAFGTVVGSSTELLDAQSGLLIAAVVTIAYTSLGGLLADAWTDLLQGTVLVLTLIVLAVVALSTEIPPEPVLASPREVPTTLARLEAWTVPILGSLFAQELAARASASRSEPLARRAAVGGGLLYLAVGVIPVGLGLLARRQLPGLEVSEAALPALSRLHLGSVGQVILSGALVSAILSTIDSALLAASGLVTHNLLPSWKTGRGRLLGARLGVIALGLVAWALARGAESVHGLVEEASAFGSAGFVVVGLGALWGGRRHASVAYATLAVGALSYVLAGPVLDAEAPFVLSLLAAAGCYGVGQLISSMRPSPS